MQDGQKFVDFYDLLQVNPECDQRILEVAFHYFAKMYHPDNLETADTDKFHEVTEAYKVLRDPVRRREFDQLYAQVSGKPFPQAALNGDVGIDEKTAQSDSGGVSILAIPGSSAGCCRKNCCVPKRPSNSTPGT